MDVEMEIATAEVKKKKLNPRQVKFIALYTTGGLTRAEAYSGAYGVKLNDQARKSAYTLIATNCDVKAQIDEIGEAKLASVKERFMLELDATAEEYFNIRSVGSPEYAVRLKACIDHFDRVGLKPKDELELSGSLNTNVSFNFGGKITEDDL